LLKVRFSTWKKHFTMKRMKNMKKNHSEKIFMSFMNFMVYSIVFFPPSFVSTKSSPRHLLFPFPTRSAGKALMNNSRSSNHRLEDRLYSSGFRGKTFLPSGSNFRPQHKDFLIHAEK
jgi:hypothetical protein